jgi:hypothetical protein
MVQKTRIIDRDFKAETQTREQTGNRGWRRKEFP